MLANYVTFFLDIFKGWGYEGILILMALESSFIPFPSELVVPPAAYLAQQGEMNVYFVVLAGVAGSLIGALLNYFLALTLGRVIVYKLINTKIAKVFLLSEKKLIDSEKYFREKGEISTFIGRLIPVIRQLISIPAGLAKMNLKKFILYTFLGALVWNIILALLGYFLGDQQELIIAYYKEISFFIILAAVIYLIYYIAKKRKRKKKLATQENISNSNIEE